MAEVHVQTRKPATNTKWAWSVLALLFIGAIVYHFANRTSERTKAISPSRPDAASQLTPKAKPPKPERLQTITPVVYMRSV